VIEILPLLMSLNVF